jgi:hypothetical protein
MNQKSLGATLITVFAPIIAIVVVAVFAWNQRARAAELDGQIAKAQSNIERVKLEMQNAGQAPRRNQVASREESPFEERDFLTLIQSYATASQLAITKWAHATPVAPTATTSSSVNPNDPPKKQYPTGIKPIVSTIELGGKYADIQQFLYFLLQDERLFTVNDVKWRRGEKWPACALSFTLTRYVHAHDPLAPPSAGQQPGQSFPSFSGSGGAASGSPSTTSGSQGFVP